MSSKSKKPAAPPQRWGLHTDVVLQKVQGREVVISLENGNKLRGTLIGYNPHTLTIMVGDDLQMVQKGHIVSTGLGQGGWASIAKGTTAPLPSWQRV